MFRFWFLPWTVSFGLGQVKGRLQHMLPFCRRTFPFLILILFLLLVLLLFLCRLHKGNKSVCSQKYVHIRTSRSLSLFLFGTGNRN